MCKWLKDEVCVNSDCPAVADFCPVVNHPGVCRYEEMDAILQRDWSKEFINLMQNRIIVSHYKYGWISQNYPELAKAIDSAEERLRLYRETGNTEWLVDLANFAMIEFMHPSHPQAHFRATGSDESPGLKNGISYKELMEEGGQRR